jgi:hypothetical protein
MVDVVDFLRAIDDVISKVYLRIVQNALYMVPTSHVNSQVGETDV